MTTVGYGDTFSISTLGRIVSVLNAIWGTFIISLVVSSIGRLFQISDSQRAAIDEIKRKHEQALKKRRKFLLFNISAPQETEDSPEEEDEVVFPQEPTKKEPEDRMEEQIRQLNAKMDLVLSHLQTG